MGNSPTTCSWTRCSRILITAAVLIYIGSLLTIFKMLRIIDHHEVHHSKKHILSGDHVIFNPENIKMTTSGAAQLQHNNIEHVIVDTEQRDKYREMAMPIASKWNLTTPNAVELLVQQFEKENDYNPETDFFHFHHLYKSGGTSISNFMDQTVGMQKVGKYWEGILPGSYESGDFNHDEALKDINKRLSEGTKREDLPYKASYAHTGLRPVYGDQRTKTAKFFQEQMPNKRLRVITMLREPTDFRASNHAMIMCGLNAEIAKFNRQRASKGLDQVCSPNDGLNISALVDVKTQNLLDKCSSGAKINAQQKQQCKDHANGVDIFEHCRSPAHLLKHYQYDKHYRSMFKGLMGRYHRGQKFGGTAYVGMSFGYERAEESEGYSVENVEEYTLQDLGGIDLSISGAGSGGPPEPDFIWFGITERMKESTILFYYYFKAKPLKAIPQHRIQLCHPTDWWTREDRDTVKEREPADYAVWRAANAILDVRMAKMKMEIQAQLDAGVSKETLYYVDWDKIDTL